MQSRATTGQVPDLKDLSADLARHRVVDERAAAAFIGLSAPSLERLRRLGRSPRWIRLSQRRLGYRVSDLLVWVEARAAETGGA